jgi:hypothetical protein
MVPSPARKRLKKWLDDNRMKGVSSAAILCRKAADPVEVVA